MARDYEIWLEMLSGRVSECYAAVRPPEAWNVPGVHRTTSRCVPNKPTRLTSSWDAGSGYVIVDIFQRVGEVRLPLEHGANAQGSVDWPGVAGGLGVRLSVAEAPPSNEKDDMEAEFLPSLPTTPIVPFVSTFTSQECPGDEAAFPMLPTPHGSPSKGPSVPWLGADAYKIGETDIRPSDIGAVQEPSPEQEYKSVTLNNCNQIIPNLYLGGVDAASDTKRLHDQGIRAVCCCLRTLEFPDEDFGKDLEYYRVDVEDMSSEPIGEFFAEASEFIHSWVAREQPVLVHCRAGVSRSASVVIAYLMRYRECSLHDAFFLVRSHRSVITPNIGFMERLGDYEEELFGVSEPTIELNKYISWYETEDRPAVPDLKPDD